MIYLILIISSLICCYISVKKMKIWLNHYTLYTIFSLGTLLLYAFNPIFKVHEYTITLLLLGTFSFNVSIILFYNVSFSLRGVTKNYINYRKPFWLLIIAIILLVPFVITFKNQLNSGFELWYIRRILTTDDLRSSFEKTIWLYYLSPVSIMLTVLSYYKFYNKKYPTQLLFFASIVITIILSFVDGGGRTGLMRWFYIYMIMLVYKKGRFSKYINDCAVFKWYYFALPVAAGIIITAMRAITNDDNSFIMALTESFTIYIGMFDYYLYNSHLITELYTCGISSLENIYLLINMLVRTFGGPDYIGNYKIVDDIIQNNVILNNGQVYNAYVSMYFRFYRDAGVFGIILGPMFLSSFLTILYKLTCNNTFYILIYVFSLSLCTGLNQELVFSKVYYFLFLLYMIILKDITFSNSHHIRNTKSFMI